MHMHTHRFLIEVEVAVADERLGATQTKLVGALHAAGYNPVSSRVRESDCHCGAPGDWVNTDLEQKRCEPT
jgi:hypothetical protein